MWPELCGFPVGTPLSTETTILSDQCVETCDSTAARSVAFPEIPETTGYRKQNRMIAAESMKQTSGNFTVSGQDPVTIVYCS